MRQLLTVFAVLAMTASGYTSSKCPAAGQTNEVVHIPHEYDCAKYYKCNDGEKQLQMCTEYSGNRKLYFNPEKQVCDWPWNVTCTQRRPECPTEGDEEVVLSHPYDCSLYYRCENRRQIVKRCPKGQHFDFVQMACMDKEQATCYLFWDVCPPSEFNIDVRFPHKSSCDAYYECVKGKIISRQCSNGYSFDVNLKKCVPTKEAKCDPALTPQISKDCPPSGFRNVPHETNCGLYYECRDGTKTKRECKGGLSFDPVSGICDWPPSNQCSTSSDFECPPQDSGKRARIPHDCSCTKYYECVNGYKILQHCKNGTEYDYLREVCDVPEKVTCINRNAEDDVVAEESECPATGTKKIRHENDCNYYYTCKNGQKELEKCLEGYHFNELLQMCDFPTNAKCQSKVITTTTPRNDDSIECPVCDCDNCVTRFPDKWNCSKYYQCENGTAISKECPDGLMYNNVTQMCDWPENVDCEEPNWSVCEEGNRTHHECRCNKYYECIDIGWAVKECPDGMLYDYIKNECVPANEAQCWPPSTIVIPDGCIGKCPVNSTISIPHEDCTKYCKCQEDGSAIIVNCTKDMYYNPNKGICDWPENIRNMTCDPFPCPSNSTDKVPHECNCEIYYLCQNGTLIREDCPPETDFNYETGECMNPEVSHCYKEPTKDTIIESEGCVGTCPNLHPDNRSITLPHKNCTKFCRCGAGAPYVLHCMSGHKYDIDRGACVKQSSAKCWSEFTFEDEGEGWTRNARKRSIWDNILSMYFQ